MSVRAQGAGGGERERGEVTTSWILNLRSDSDTRIRTVSATKARPLARAFHTKYSNIHE
jgi:hypothetical protein